MAASSTAAPLPRPADRPNADVVIYDGDCGICTAQVSKLPWWDYQGKLAYLSLHDPEVKERFPDLSHDRMMQEIDEKEEEMYEDLPKKNSIRVKRAVNSRGSDSVDRRDHEPSSGARTFTSVNPDKSRKQTSQPMKNNYFAHPHRTCPNLASRRKTSCGGCRVRPPLRFDQLVALVLGLRIGRERLREVEVAVDVAQVLLAVVAHAQAGHAVAVDFRRVLVVDVGADVVFQVRLVHVELVLVRHPRAAVHHLPL